MEEKANETNTTALDNNWLVIYTAPRAEKKVYERLLEAQIECYMPTYITERQWSDRRKKVVVPLFNSYIFVRVQPWEMASVIKIFGVVRFVHYLQKPAIVREVEIERIRLFLKQTEGYRIMVERGDSVKISTGLMEGVSGIVLRVSKDKVIIRVEQLGLSVTATIPRGQLTKNLITIK